MSRGEALLRVDFSGARARRIGAERGIAPSEERAWRLRSVQAREVVRAAQKEGRLPGGADWLDQSDEVLPLHLPVTVLGEPGATAAICLGLDGRNGVSRASWWAGGEGEVLRVDGGPHLPGEGNPADDRCFGPFGTTARRLRHTVLGADAASAVDDALILAAAACEQTTGDPSADLASALCSPGFDASALVIVAEPGLDGLSKWWAGALSSVTCKPATTGAAQVPRGLPTMTAPLADEAALQVVFHSDPPPWVMLLTHDRSPPEVVRVREATRTLLLRAGHPHVELRLKDAAAPTVLGSALVCLEATLAVAVAVGVDPMTRLGGPELRQRMVSSGDTPA